MFQHEREFSGATACHEFTSNVSKPWPVTSLKNMFWKNKLCKKNCTETRDSSLRISYAKKA